MRPEEEITCREFVELITDYFEDALPAETLAYTEEHLVMCDWCATYAAQMRFTSEALRETALDVDRNAEADREPGADARDPHPPSTAPAHALLAALRARQGAQP